MDRETGSIPRDLLEKYFKEDPRLIAAFEDQSIAVAQTIEVVDGAVTATTRLQDATVVTLSPNDELNNEFIMTGGDGTDLSVVPGSVKVDVDETVARVTNDSVTFVPPGHVTLFLPAEGTLISAEQPATLYAKTLDKPTFTAPVIINGLVTADTDAAAAAAGVPVHGLYLDGNHVCLRRT
jgi:hypothetical protein